MKVAIIGSGFGGLCAAIQLKQAGIDCIIFEKADGVGGTWRENTYPGAACDVPSHLYSYSFKQQPHWSRKFSPQPEILAYLEDCAESYGLMPLIRFKTAVEKAVFDEIAGLWTVTTNHGETHTFNAVISACGQLNRPAVPDLPGLSTFAGEQFHSANWNHQYDLRGKCVAVVGTGASALQFVPEIAPQVAELTVFQRSPNWVISKPDRQFLGLEKALFAHLPGWAKTYREQTYWMLEARFPMLLQGGLIGKVLRRYLQHQLKKQIKNPVLRAKLTPDYPVGCKRILISNDYYDALQRDNVALVTDNVARVTPTGIVTKDGCLHEVDAIIFGTGFKSTDFLAPMQVVGRNGQALNDAWQAGAEAHLGITVSGFPNFYMLYGPNTNLGHNSIIFMIECQVNYALQCIQKITNKSLKYLDLQAKVQQDYNQALQQRLAKTVWNAGCHNWYLADNGKNTNNWPGLTAEYRRRTRKVDFSSYTEVV